MNLLLLHENDFINEGQVRLHDRRLTHLNSIHKAKIGNSITLGLINNKVGHGTITSIDTESVTIDVNLTKEPPLPLPLTLVLALPRPNMLKRSLQTCATMGVKNIILLNTARVEKSYWQSPQLAKEKIHENLILGLEQAKDTVLPKITFEKNFTHFVKEILPDLCKHSLGLLAHPNSSQTCPSNITKATTLLIGPEGGFIGSEVDKIIEAGCESIEIGNRILRVETAIPVLLSKLFF